MRVLVTGDRRHIGQVLVPTFRAAGHEVVGLDAEWHLGCDHGPAVIDPTRSRCSARRS